LNSYLQITVLEDENVVCSMCNSDLHWSGNFTCEEVNGCECTNGVIGYWYCSKCKSQFEITTNCKTLEDLF